jgi:hypothetical protein
VLHGRRTLADAPEPPRDRSLGRGGLGRVPRPDVEDLRRRAPGVGATRGDPRLGDGPPASCSPVP